MSTTGQNAQQLQQDIQQELLTANQLLNLISTELKLIKIFTNPGGELESTIKDNASLMETLAKLQQVDLNSVPSMVRRHIDMNTLGDQNSTLRNDSEMDSQMTT